MDLHEFNEKHKRNNKLLIQINKKITRLEARADELFNESREIYKTAWENNLDYDDEKGEWKLKEDKNNGIPIR